MGSIVPPFGYIGTPPKCKCILGSVLSVDRVIVVGRYIPPMASEVLDMKGWMV